MGLTVSKLAQFCGTFVLGCVLISPSFADRGVFDFERWDAMLNDIRTKAVAQKISDSTIDDTLKDSVFVPRIVKSDKNQKEFTLTLDKYLQMTVSNERITNGKTKRGQYKTLLHNVENKFGVQPNVILAFWGMESNYGKVKSRHQLTNAFLTLIYEGRREEFFSNQLLALMKIADKNKLNVKNIHGSWAGAMGHFQFIPTTLAQYGMDGNYDGHVDIINSIGDAMYSAANYLHKLGWNKNEKIVRRVILPGDFDRSLLNGDVKKSLSEWTDLGVTNPDGTPIPNANMVAGLVADTKEIARQDLFHQTTTESQTESDIEIAPKPVITAYLTYPNFYRIKKWNNSSWYAIAIAELADKLKI